MHEWLGHALLYLSFAVGAVGGGVISVLVTGPPMLLVASAISAAAAVCTDRHADQDVPILG